MTETFTTPETSSHNDREILLELPRYYRRKGPKGIPAFDLKDASPELIGAVCHRYKDCEALGHCRENNFNGKCCCVHLLESKLSYTPTEPSRRVQREHEKQFKTAYRLVCTTFSSDGDKWDAGTKAMLQFQFDFSCNPMAEAKRIINQLNPKPAC